MLTSQALLSRLTAMITVLPASFFSHTWTSTPSAGFSTHVCISPSAVSTGSSDLISATVCFRDAQASGALATVKLPPWPHHHQIRQLAFFVRAMNAFARIVRPSGWNSAGSVGFPALSSVVCVRS